MTPSYWYEEWRKERAKVAALEAEQRLMQAEAQLLREEQGADEAVKHIMELETEMERLQCCGNCSQLGSVFGPDVCYTNFGNRAHSVLRHSGERCKYEPSLWELRPR